MAIEPNTNQTVTWPKEQARPGRLFNWIAGLFALFCVLLIVYNFLGYDDAWQAFKSLDPANDKTKTEELKALKVEAFRNFLLSIGALGAVVIGLVGLALAIVRTSALHRQANVAETDSKLSEQKHQSEAFTKAIELLGNKEDSFAIQLGAVYALEALAKSSKELHGPIFETLCAYVREKAPAKGISDLGPVDEIDAQKSIRNLLESIDTPHVVVQAILTVIGRRDPKRDPDGFSLDLGKTNLRNADLSNGHFENAIFTGARIEGGIIRNTHLDGAFLYNAHLEDAILIDAHLEDAIMMDVHLNGAILRNAHLEGADLNFAHLNDANLLLVYFDAETHVHGANFQGARHIPARPGNDFRATVGGAYRATWPDDDDTNAWNRGEDDHESDNY